MFEIRQLQARTFPQSTSGRAGPAALPARSAPPTPRGGREPGLPPDSSSLAQRRLQALIRL